VVGAVGSVIIALVSAPVVGGRSNGRAPASALPGPYSLTARQSRDVRTTTGFLEAFNAGNVKQALTFFSASAGVSDCDYGHVRPVQFRGLSEIRSWLLVRARDRDELVVDRIFNDNPSQTTGVLAVEYSRRTSTTLRRLGYADGVKPLPTKVITSLGGRAILSFVSGPVGGSSELCRPSG
jgi:hypothetical protein